jgi:hypothetical protein
MSTTRSARSESEPAAGARQHGIGLVGSLAGVVAFLSFLLFAVQLAYDLYATSAVTSAAFDAVRVVAGADAATDANARDEAEDRARAVLGSYGERVTFTWSVDDTVVRLRVQATNPSFLPAALRRPLHLDEVDRTVRARVERFR